MAFFVVNELAAVSQTLDFPTIFKIHVELSDKLFDLLLQLFFRTCSSMEDDGDESWVPPAVGTPWLVYTHVESEKLQSFCNVFGSNSNNTYVKSIPELRCKLVCACCRGWLILRDLVDKKLFSLWNPYTLKSLSLPQLPIDVIDVMRVEEEEVCTLITSDVGDNGSDVRVVLLFFGDVVYLYHPASEKANNDSSWVRYTIVVDGERLDMREIVTVDNIVCGWAKTEGFESVLVSMEVGDDVSDSLTIKSLPMEWPRSGIGCVHRMDYWVESCGRIYHVCAYIRHSGDDRISMVKVLELDLVGRNWIEINSLDGRAFFVGKDCSTWCWGGGNDSGSVQGNSIYFLFPEMDDEVFYCYSLDEGCLTVFSCCPMLHSRNRSIVWLNMTRQHHGLLGVEDAKVQEPSLTKATIVDEVLDHGIISSSSSIKYNELSQEKEKQGESQFIKLPDHLITLISRDMHLFDYWNFRASCKTFQSAVSSSPCRTNAVLPLFIFMKHDGLSCEIIDPCRDYSCCNILNLSSDPFAIDFSKDGWLVISVGPYRTLKYFNPFTRVKGDFPIDFNMSMYSSIGFSTYPTSHDCLAIVIVDKFIAVEINYAHYGDDTWDSFEFRHVDLNNRFRPGTGIPVYFARAFYVLDKIGYLGKFALVGGEGSWKVYDRPETRNSEFHSSHLVECDGELHAVFIGYMGIWTEVFKFNFEKEKWTEVSSLGNHSLLVSHTSSFCIETAEVGMQNRVYLPRLKENHILYYSLRTGKYHVCGSEESMENFYHTKEPLQCCWL